MHENASWNVSILDVHHVLCHVKWKLKPEAIVNVINIIFFTFDCFLTWFNLDWSNVFQFSCVATFVHNFCLLASWSSCSALLSIKVVAVCVS